jgi:hypothetical protein
MSDVSLIYLDTNPSSNDGRKSKPKKDEKNEFAMIENFFNQLEQQSRLPDSFYQQIVELENIFDKDPIFCDELLVEELGYLYKVR